MIEQKKYSLGLKLWQIGMLAYGQNHISITLKPYLRKLRDLTGETANLTIMDNYQIVYIAQEESNSISKDVYNYRSNSTITLYWSR